MASVREVADRQGVDDFPGIPDRVVIICFRIDVHSHRLHSSSSLED